MKLYIRTDPNAPNPPLVASDESGAPPVSLASIATKNVVPVEVYLVDGSGAYDTRSGSADYSVRVGIGTLGAVPTSGTWTLTFGANTASGLAFDISAADLQTALNALGSVASAGGVTVAGSSGKYVVTWVTSGAKDDFTSASNALLPISRVSISVQTAGGTGVNEVVWIELVESLISEQSLFTPITDGWSGAIQTWTDKAAEQLNGVASKSFTLEVSLVDGSGNIATVLQSEIEVVSSLVSSDTLSPFTPAAPGFAETDPVFSAWWLTTPIDSVMYAALVELIAQGGHGTMSYATMTQVINYVTSSSIKKQGGTNAQRSSAATSPLPQLYYQTDDVEFPRGLQFYTGAQWVPLGSVYNTSDSTWYYTKASVSTSGVMQFDWVPA